MTPPPAATPTAIDLLIEARWTIPIEPAGVVLEEHAVAIDEGRIVALLPAAEAATRYLPRQQVSLDDHVLLPGLVNLHTHAAMTLLRGYADDLPLMRWLGERIWPAEAQYVSPDFVRDGTTLAAAEMLRGGITCFSDMYFFPEAAAEAALRMGMRAAIGIIAFEFPTAYGSDANDYLAKGLAVRDALREEALLSFCLAPHAPYAVSDATFERVATLAAQLDLPVHMHVHETLAEVEESIRQYGVRPLERLQRLGLLAPGLIAVHAVHLTPAEIELLATHGCAVAHCPTSNMKLGSGIAPLAALLDQGIRVGLGSDGAASNNRLDLWRELRQASLLAKVAKHDAAAVDAHTALRMATLNGAAALGLDGSIGSIAPGKLADLCAVRLDEWIMRPCFDAASHLVNVAGREQVSHVWVGGNPRLIEGRLTEIKAEALGDIAELWQNELSRTR
jgi:5-methylthioadenosine/S-adenosylhomocysteine deaminase